MFGLENRGKTLIFMSRRRHFDETMTILISHFLHFGALKNLTGVYFVLRINKKDISNKKWDVLFISVFSQHFSHFPLLPSTFPTSDFPIPL